MTRVCVLNEFKAKLQTMDDAAVDDMIDECDVNNDFADEILTQFAAENDCPCAQMHFTQ